MKNIFILITKKSLFLFFIIFPLFSTANVIISGTRVIYVENEKEMTVKLTNEGNFPVLIQSWIDGGEINASPENVNVPFVITPPVVRIEADQAQTLRLSYTASKELPKDRESVYWLNILEIPPSSKTLTANQLQIAYRSRIKLFYRPLSINETKKVIEAAESLIFVKNKNGVDVYNHSPYYISLVSFNIGNNTKAIDGEMISPFSHLSFKTDKISAINQGNNTIIYNYVNDWGALKSVQTKIENKN